MADNWTTSSLPPTNATTTPHLAPTSQVVISVFYAVGILANVAALAILCSGRKYRNHKHTLMLRFLTANDLVALVGMLVQMYLQLHGVFGRGRLLCVFRVIWRFFGFSSGCVAIVMAVERWLALTHPFVYQKHVTPAVIKRGIFALWLAALVLVCLPFLGFGLYYVPLESKCARYKDATTPTDRAYAFLFCAVGMLMVVCLVLCNVSVIRALCRMGYRGQCKKGSEVLGRRISRSSSRASRTTIAAVGPPPAAAATAPVAPIYYNSSTREELTFARLMAIICIVFVMCWLPQMAGVLLSQLMPKSPFTQKFGRMADILLSLHYMLNPFIYVLLSFRGQPCLPGLLKFLCRRCRRQEGMRSSGAGSVVTDQEHLESTECPSSPMVTSSLL